MKTYFIEKLRNGRSFNYILMAENDRTVFEIADFGTNKKEAYKVLELLENEND